MPAINELGFTHRFEPPVHPGAPTLLLLHGSGGDEASLLALGRAIAPGAALLSPRGKAIDHGAHRFFERPGQHAEATEIQGRIQELNTFACSAMLHYKLTPPLVLVGFSNGAIMALLLLLHAQTNWDGAILMRGMKADFDSAARPLPSTPVLILSGIADPLVQSDQAEDLAAQLRLAGAEVTLHWEEAGHNLSQGDVLMAFDWVRRFYNSPR